jgi:adenylate kinase family enzyme
MNHPSVRSGLERVVVVGSSCSGKTTYARRLGEILGQSHIELDALNWLPNWVQRPTEEFRSLVDEAVSRERWVVDGNYGKARDIVWPRATCVVWLNYGFPTVMTRALRRTMRRALTGEELYSGNRESLRMAFLQKDSLLLWIITTFRRRRRDLARLRSNQTFPQLQWLEFQTPMLAEQFLQSRANINGR